MIQLTARVTAVRAQFVADLKRIDLTAPPQGAIPDEYAGTPLAESTDGVLMHVFEEIAQHHGHLDLTRDLVQRAQRGQ